MSSSFLRLGMQARFPNAWRGPSHSFDLPASIAAAGERVTAWHGKLQRPNPLF